MTQIINPNDIEITCKDCHETFVWSEREQEFYAENDYVQPKRCKKCRQALKNKIARRGRK